MGSPSGLRPRERSQKAGATAQVFRVHSEHRPPSAPHPFAGADLGEHCRVPDVAHPFHGVKNEFIPSLDSGCFGEGEQNFCLCLVALGVDPWGFVPWDVSLQ